jgi:hypothetical protein
VVQEAIRGTGGLLPRLVLTHPASWDDTRLATLTEAGFHTGLGVPTLVPAPVAAAWYQAEAVGDLAQGRCLVVYHLGAGTFEVSLLRRTPAGYDLVVASGLDDVGGVDLDDVLIKVVGDAIPPGAAEGWQSLLTPTTAADLRAFMQLCEDARSAKEALSRQLAVAMHIPILGQDVQISRADFESAAEPLLARTVELTADLLAATETTRDQLSEVLLLGGSSRIPLVTALLRGGLGIAPVAGKQPELAVAEGALIATARGVAVPPEPAQPPVARREPPTPARTLAAAPPAGAGPRRRPTRLLAIAAGLVLLAMIGWYATRPSAPVGSAIGSAPTGTPAGTAGSGIDVRAGGSSTQGTTVPGSGVPQGSPPAPLPPVPATSAPPSTSPSATTGPRPVTVSVTASPTSGPCSANYTFLVHVTVNDGGRYRWHLTFDGPDNYSSTSGDHDQNKSGDTRVNKKFEGKRPGTYRAQAQITSPVTVTSDPVSVELIC